MLKLFAVLFTVSFDLLWNDSIKSGWNSLKRGSDQSAMLTLDSSYSPSLTRTKHWKICLSYFLLLPPLFNFLFSGLVGSEML